MKSVALQRMKEREQMRVSVCASVRSAYSRCSIGISPSLNEVLLQLSQNELVALNTGHNAGQFAVSDDERYGAV